MTLRFSTTSAFNNGFQGNLGAGVYTGMPNNIYGNMIMNGDYKGILESKDQTMQNAEGYDISRSGRDAVLTTKISNICSYLANGEEDYALEAYNDLLKEMGGQIRYNGLSSNEDQAQLRSVARQLIEMELGGDLEEFIRENTRDAKGVEYQQKMFGADKVDSVSTEDLLYEMCEIKERKETMKWYDKSAFDLDWFFNPWQRWFSGDRVN